MNLEQMLSYLSIISFLIGICIIIYQFGKWRQKSETDKEEMKKKLDAISEKVENVPEHFWSKFIDAYRLLEKTEETTKKEREND